MTYLNRILLQSKRAKRAAAALPLGFAVVAMASGCAGSPSAGSVASTLPLAARGAAGSEHLAGWASAAAVVVTAGASSPERIFAVGELIRLAEVPVLSTVLIGADRDDQSLGVLPAPGLGSEIEVVTRPKGLFVAPAGAAIEE